MDEFFALERFSFASFFQAKKKEVILSLEKCPCPGSEKPPSVKHNAMKVLFTYAARHHHHHHISRPNMGGVSRNSTCIVMERGMERERAEAKKCVIITLVVVFLSKAMAG